MFKSKNISNQHRSMESALIARDMELPALQQAFGYAIIRNNPNSIKVNGHSCSQFEISAQGVKSSLLFTREGVKDSGSIKLMATPYDNSLSGFGYIYSPEGELKSAHTTFSITYRGQSYYFDAHFQYNSKDELFKIDYITPVGNNGFQDMASDPKTIELAQPPQQATALASFCIEAYAENITLRQAITEHARKIWQFNKDLEKECKEKESASVELVFPIPSFQHPFIIPEPLNA